MTRISLQQAFSQGLRGLTNVQSQLFKTQDQVSSGRRVLTPGDDPIAASRILQLEQAGAEITQYKKNIDGVRAGLGLEDSQLDAVGTLLIRVRELAVQAGNGTISSTDRDAIAAELNTRLDELVALANTRATSGEYIFGGYQGEQEPFVRNGNNYTYRGDNGQRSVQVSASSQVPAGDSGNAVFVAVPSPRPSGDALPTNTGGGSISNGRILDQVAFETNFTGPYTITISDPGGGVAPTYQIDTVPVTVPLETGEFVPGEPIEVFGASFRISGTPADGDAFEIRGPNTQGIIETVARLAQGVANLGDSTSERNQLQDLISESLDNLGSAEAHIGSVRAQVGARLNTLDSLEALQDGVDLVNQQVLAEVRDLDYAEALTRLTKEQTVLQAAQQSFAKISKLSLFNFMS